MSNLSNECPICFCEDCRCKQYAKDKAVKKLKEIINNIGLDWLEGRTILLLPYGSRLYGTDTVDSDWDFKGVCIPPKDYYLGLNTFNEYNNTGGKTFKNTKDDVDVNILHISKFVKDAMQGVPNNIEMLFARPEDYIWVSELGRVLLDNRQLFLSKQIVKKFGGYTTSLVNKLKNGAGRTELIEQHGYDTKNFMQGVRLLISAIEILDTGDYRTYRPEREFLLECRNGKHTLEQALSIIAYYEHRLQEAHAHSALPDKPDYDKINNMLMGINEDALKFGIR
ncbi:putative nucleotidyltransferase [Bacillus phage vB_BanH_Emiliahah]|nr:putative nucleotidyltransferase [Bacillus phage vB_BanH_Emiliahah]